MNGELSNGSIENVSVARGYRARTALWFDKKADLERSICEEAIRLEGVILLKRDIKKKLAKKHKLSIRTIERYLRKQN